MEHSGGIHGFVTYALRMPSEGVFVALLSNNPGAASNELLALKVVALLIGQPYRDPTPLALGPHELARYTGVYRSATIGESTIVCENDRLIVQEPGSPGIALVPVSSNTFYPEIMPRDRLVFMVDASGVVKTLEWRGRSGAPIVSERIDAPASS